MRQDLRGRRPKHARSLWCKGHRRSVESDPPPVEDQEVLAVHGDLVGLVSRHDDGPMRSGVVNDRLQPQPLFRVKPR